MTDDVLLLQNALLCAQARPPLPTGEKHVDAVNGKTYDCCLCGAVNEPGHPRCMNAAHWGNVQKRLTDEIARLKYEAQKRIEALPGVLDDVLYPDRTNGTSTVRFWRERAEKAEQANREWQAKCEDLSTAEAGTRVAEAKRCTCLSNDSDTRAWYGEDCPLHGKVNRP